MGGVINRNIRISGVFGGVDIQRAAQGTPAGLLFHINLGDIGGVFFLPGHIGRGGDKSNGRIVGIIVAVDVQAASQADPIAAGHPFNENLITIGRGCGPPLLLCPGHIHVVAVVNGKRGPDGI